MQTITYLSSRHGFYYIRIGEDCDDITEICDVGLDTDADEFYRYITLKREICIAPPQEKLQKEEEK